VRKSEKKVFAYIEYEQESFAEKSLELNDAEFVAGKPRIKVAISDPRKKQPIV
jgi:hypothetical protein